MLRTTYCILVSLLTQTVRLLLVNREKLCLTMLLAFVPGEEDIENLADKLHDYRNSLFPELEILPCYSAMPWEQQKLIFEPAKEGKRKVSKSLKTVIIFIY